MVFRYLLALLLLLPLSVGAAPDAACEAALVSLFKAQVTKEEAAEFLKVQGDLTLHRLAWAYLKAQKLDSGDQLANTERTILTLLDEKYTSTDPGFIKARNAFEDQPLSRTALAEIGPYLKEVLSQEFGEEDSPFVLNASDLKLLHALARYEKSSAVKGQYDSRMLARKSPQGMLNFMKIINSSYKLDQNSEEKVLNIEVRLQGIQRTLSNLQKRLNDFLKQMELPQECVEQTECPPEGFDEFFKQNENVQAIFWDSLADKLQSDDLLLDNLTYGEIWLKTNGQVGAAPKVVTVPVKKQATPPSKKPAPAQKPVQKQVMIAGKKKVTTPSPVRTHYASSTGMYVEDPVAIIVKDRDGRKPASWKTFDKIFLEKMSDAILNDDKAFENGGNLYDRRTGKSLSVDKAMEFLPPKKREEYKKFLTSQNKQILSRQVAAMVNGDATFSYQDKLYGINGKELSAAEVISSEMTKKTGIQHPAKNYQGMEKGYLVVRAQSLKNNKPHFKYKNEVFDTETGRSLTSPFRSRASTQDMKVSKQRRVQYQNLSDKEVVINFHRDRPDKSGCQHYAILDKLNAEISVYNLAGQKVFQTEALVGNVRSDEKTYWTEYNERLKMTNRSTGAGIYTINQPKLNNSYYKRNFSNNILQLSDQNGKDQVFAIHQVPNGMPERNQLFGSNPEKRWVSSGCANLRLEDYLKITQWLKPSCQIYVLPEEKNNKFVVKDGSIRMVSDRHVPNAHRYNYNYGTKFKPIDIRITDAEGKTAQSEAFVKALEDEKSKLMGIFNLTNDDYNELAALSYAIMGNESDFGRSKKYWYKENFQGDVIIAKAAKRLFEGKDPFDKSVTNTSRGFTQIKMLPEGSWRKHYPEVTKENLGNPKNSAVATMAYLVDAVGSLRRIAAENAKDPRKVRISKENIVDYLGYIYQGRRGALTSADDPANADFNTYVQGLRKHMSYIELSQKIE